MLKWLGPDRLPLAKQIEELSRLASTLAFNRDGESWAVVLCTPHGEPVAVATVRGPRQLEVFTYGMRKLGYLDHDPSRSASKSHPGDYFFRPAEALNPDGLLNVYARLTPW